MKQRPDLNILAKEVFEANKAKGFHEEEHSNEHHLCLVISELMEAVEADRKGRFHYAKNYSNEKKYPIVEEWRGVVGYESEYEVSNFGRVRSKDLQVWNGKVYYTKKGRVLSAGLGGTGYYTVALRGRTHKVSVLVASAFAKKNQDSEMVNHIDGDKTNDNIGNLEWVSYSQNNRHAFNSGLHDRKQKWAIPYENRCEIAFKKKSGTNYTTIFKENNYNVTKSAIQLICKKYDIYTDSVEMELADAVIRLLDLAGLRGCKPCTYGKAVRDAKDQFEAFPLFSERIYHIITHVMKPERYENPQYIGIINYTLSAIEALCELLSIDLWLHVELKLKYNKTREYKHGKNY